jgi:AcrR family transcriptional regulator
LECFTRHVARRGIDRASLDDVARELGLSKGTIVYHFGTKDAMLAAQHESYMRRRLDEAVALVSQLDGSPAQVAGLIHALARVYDVDRDAAVAVNRGFVRVLEGDGMDEVRRLRRKYEDLWVGVVTAGVRERVFCDAAPDISVALLSGAVQWMWTWFPQRRRTAAQVGSHATRLFLRGLLEDPAAVAPLASATGRPARVAARVVRRTDFSVIPT